MRPGGSTSMTLEGQTPSHVGELATLPGDATEPRRSEPDRAEEPVPETFGRFAVRGVLGRGGMSTVLEAYDESLDREIALKVLHLGTDSRDGSRLVREAQALARLSHPNVVHVYEVGEVEGQTFIAMELIRGRTLQQWQARRPPWKECVEVYLQAGQGLVAAHGVGLVHRDFKPSNCIVDDDGQVRVLDFGLARGQLGGFADDELDLSPCEAGSRSGSTGPSVPSSLTQTGAVLGTLAYMPLEQLEGGGIDERSDQFSLCVSLYEALYGERPFEDASVGKLTTALIEGVVRPAPAGAVVPARLRRVLLRGLAVEPDERWPSVAALLEELARLIAPRRRRWIALAIGGGLAAFGGGLWQQARGDHRCEGSRDQLVGIWDETRAQEVEGALRATELSYAEDTWSAVEPRLDAYADAWVKQHRDACEATIVHGAQTETMMDLRMGCLSSRRIALREVVDVMAQADDGVVEQAISLAVELPSVDRCDDEEALQAEVAPPEDPAVAAQVQAQRERLVEIDAQAGVGRYDDAQAEIEAVMKEAEALTYPPLQAEASMARGKLRMQQGQYPEAEGDLVHAYSMAVEHGHERVAAEATQWLVLVVGTQQARFAEGRQWGITAMALATRQEPLAEARVQDRLGALLVQTGDYELALEHHQRALDIRHRHMAPDDPALARTLDLVGRALRALGRHEEALDHHRRALIIQQRAHGPQHPQVAATLMDLGTVVGMRGQFEQSLDYHRQALAIQERARGSEHPSVGMILGSIGMMLRQQEKFDEAGEHYRRALRILEATLGPEHPQVAGTRANLGVMLQSRGQQLEALEQYQRAQDALVKALGEDHPNVAVVVDNIGTILQSEGRYAEAETYHRRALAARERSLGPEHPETARARANVGLSLTRQGRVEEGLVEQRRALELLETAWGPGHVEVATALSIVAESERLAGRPEVARPLVERALGIFDTKEATVWQRGSVRFILARSLWPSEPGERVRALELARRARELFVEAGVPAQHKLAEADAWLAEHDDSPTPAPQ